MPPVPDAVSLLNVWLALEALQPQTFPAQDKLLGGEAPRRQRGERIKTPARLLVDFDLNAGVMPWEQPTGDRVFLGLAPDEVIRWYVPLGFIQMKPAVERLIQEVEMDGPEREPASGLAILALAAFNEKGFPLKSNLLLSSFGWACGQVLAGRVGDLHRFVDVERDICDELADALVERGEDGVQIPTGKRGFAAAMNAVLQTLALPRELLQRPEYAIRIIGDGDKEPVDIINSFFLRDLDRVRTAAKNDDVGPALALYLAQRRPDKRCNVLADKAVLDDLVAPGRLPPARWPSPKPAKLVTLQQAAVNAAMDELGDGGILSVNGPPGTGKTTLLRDVVAAVIGRRADALLTFAEPASAFKAVDLVSESGYPRKLYRLDEKLRGHGIVVASSNNAAVRNVSAELPLMGSVAADFSVRHFPGTADVVNGVDGGCWGLVAAVLGNRANRTDFVEGAWWHPDWGLEKYFAAAVKGATAGKYDRLPPKIVEAERPPNRNQARENWRRACIDYREKRAVVERMAVWRERVRAALGSAASDQQAMEDAGAASTDALRDVEAAEQTRRLAEQSLTRAETAVDDARRLVDGNAAVRPGAIARLFGGDARWKESHEEALKLMHRALADREAIEREVAAARDRAMAAERRADAARTKLAAAEQSLALLRDVEAEIPAAERDTLVGPSFWDGGHERIHLASPWADAEFVAARDEMFAAALRLHRAFIDAAAAPMRSNLCLMMDHLKGKRIPSGADLHLPELWDSLFLLVPLVSTTFASFDRLMDGIGRESIGWLIVDEAGQATPQATVGALWRSRRVLIIGDPLQIEPVSTIPAGLIRSICAAYGAHPDLWAAPRASVQTLADAASPLMTMMDSGAGLRAIGLPLLVHRRCQEPMFSISNEIAYGGLMVHAAGDPSSTIADVLSPWLPVSAWIDVVSEKEKWSQEEGDVVVALLRKLSAGGLSNPNLYVITPFREVAERLRAHVVRSGVLADLGIAKEKFKKWGEQHIGTVHTFQGKEAEAVFLVLGASAADRRGARNWAGGSPNILNVAATRAKKALYVIGRYDVWATAGVFATAARELPRVSWPFDEAGDSVSDHPYDALRASSAEEDQDARLPAE